MTDLDLTAAQKLARGTLQKQWLCDLADLKRGLCIDQYSYQYTAEYRRMVAFVESLTAVGYLTEKRPFGPYGIERRVLCGYHPTSAALRAAYCKRWVATGELTPQQLCAWADTHGPTAASVATALLESRMSHVDALAAAEAVAA